MHAASAVTQLVQVMCFCARVLKETKPVLLFRFCELFVCVCLVFFGFFFSSSHLVIVFVLRCVQLISTPSSLQTTLFPKLLPLHLFGVKQGVLCCWVLTSVE